jgi:hypothetical protein
MPYTMEDFRRDYVKEHLKDLTVGERLEGLSPEQLLAALSREDRAALRKMLEADEPPTPPEPSSGT